MRARIELHIKELVVSGFPCTEVEAVPPALRAQLTRLLTERGLVAGIVNDAALGDLPAPDVVVAAPLSGVEVGRSSAESLHRLLQRSGPGAFHPSPTREAQSPSTSKSS